MAVPYYGDFAEDDTVLIPFNTFDSNDPQASATITNLADADIMVHKDGGLTQIATDGATVVINFDSITGNHMITIDTSVDAAYATGSEYSVRIEGTTVDTGTINAWVGSFSIERAGGVLELLKATTLASIKSETALIVADTNELQGDWANGGRLDLIQDIIAADTTTDIPALIATAQADLDIITGASGVNLLTATQTSIDAIEADTNELQAEWVDGGRLDLILDIIAADTTTDIPALINGLDDVTAAEVLTQINTALDTAISELSVAAPAATPTLRTGLMLLYMALRNKTVVQTSGTDALEIYNNAGTKIAAKLLTDDGSDYTEAEMA